MKPFIFAFIFLTLSLAGTVTQAKQFQPENHTNLDQAVQQVKKQTGGRILSAKTKNNDGKKVHKIKVLLPNGKVRIIRVNAK